MSFDNLPRDVQLKVFQKLDMDGRINVGIINKLKIPKTLSDKIAHSFSLRLPINDWLIKEKPCYINQKKALNIPISEGAFYELYYGGDFWYFQPNAPNEALGFINKLLYCPLESMPFIYKRYQEKGCPCNSPQSFPGYFKPHKDKFIILDNVIR